MYCVKKSLNPLQLKRSAKIFFSVLQHQLLRDKFLILFSFKHCALGKREKAAGENEVKMMTGKGK